MFDLSLLGEGFEKMEDSDNFSTHLQQTQQFEVKLKCLNLFFN